jgi:hypothetical protein
MRILAGLIFVASLSAVQIPTGAELNIRLEDKVASDAKTQPASIRAVLIAPVIVDGKVAISAGAELTGAVKQARPAADNTPAQLQLEFTEISSGAVRTRIPAVVSGLDNAREKVDNTGLITGIDPGATYSARIDQGVSKLQSNEKYAGLASLITGVKQALNIEDAKPDIDYDPGVELTLRTTQAFEWKGVDNGPTSHLQPIPNENALAELVNRQPFRTLTQAGARPSDMTNLMFLGTEEELVAAFEKAGWSQAARLSTSSKMETARALIESRGYKEGPMSVLMLDGHAPDYAFQKGNNTYAQRHHLRIFRRPDTFLGKPVWVCSATHDTGIDFSEREHTFIHKIDSQIDRERAKVTNDLLFTGMVRSISLVPRPNIPQDASNATGDALRTDGGMVVLLFQ